jgi:hypothetical protein
MRGGREAWRLGSEKAGGIEILNGFCFKGKEFGPQLNVLR